MSLTTHFGTFCVKIVAQGRVAKLADAQGLGPCPAYRGVRVQISPRPLNMEEKFLLNQNKAASYTKKVIDDLDKEGKLGDNFLIFRTNDLKEITRHLCLPTVCSSAINILRGKKIIGDEDGDFRVGDFYRIFIPLHSTKPTGLPAPYDKGWWVMDKEGNIFHQAIIAFAKAFGIQAQSIIDYPSVEWVFEKIGKHRAAAVSVSVNNGKGRHALLILSFQKGKCLVSDPLNPNPRFVAASTINKSLARNDQRPSQGIVFSREPIIFPKKYLKKIYIPNEVEKKLDDAFLPQFIPVLRAGYS